MANNVRIHPTAEVSPKAVLGEGTSIWNNCQVRENAIIGKNCILSKDVYIDQGVVIGNGVKIQNGVSVYQGVLVEDGAFLGPHCVFTNDFRPRSFNTSWKITSTKVCTGASIGAGAIIVCGTELGRYSMVGAGAVVTKSVPEHGLVVGNPARLVGYVCKCGERSTSKGVTDKTYFCVSCLTKENYVDTAT